VKALSDAAWREICEPAELDTDADARAELSVCLFIEYPAFTYDRKRVAADLRRDSAKLKHYKALAELYQQTPPLPGDDIKRERDLFYIERLHRRALAGVLACRAIRRANRRRSNPQREWLISRLSGIWLYNFGAPDLTYTVPSWGGPPSGPLIEFLLAAMRQIVPHDKLPKAHAWRDLIDRERRARENARQLRLDLRRRSNEVLTRKKNF
jgi:hypothetical protein